MSTATTIEAVDVEFTSDGSAKSLSDNHHDSEKAVPPHLPALAPIQSNRSLAPEGGLEAWLVVLGAWCCSFCSFGWINSVGVFQNYYETGPLSNYSPSTVSWILSLEVFFLLGMSPIVGKIYDNYGPRYLLLGGTFLHVFGLMMASISTQYYQLLLSQGICSAIGASCIFTPSFNCVVGYFDKRRAAAFGILATGSSTGGVVLPIMVTHLIERIGFGWAMRICAFLILFLLTIANLTVKSRIAPQPRTVSLLDFLKPFTEVTYLLSVVGNFLFTFAFFMPISYIVVEATLSGMGTQLAQYLVAILNAASLFGRLGAGVLADKSGKFNVFSGVALTTAILILALWIPAGSNSARIAFAILFGFFSGAYASLGPALVAQISPIKDIGLRTGMFFAVSSIASLISGPVAGALLAADDEKFLALKLFAGVLCLIGTVFILGARVSRTGFKLLVKF